MTFPTWPSAFSPRPRSRRARGQRGAVLPSPVVLLSIVAVALAAVAFVVTRDTDPSEREITTVAEADPSASADPTDDAAEEPETEPTAEPTKKAKPPVQRDEVGVVVFNNTSIAGLAGEVGNEVSEIGWNFVAADNWYGTVLSTTVYYPPGMKREARQLALDLGIQRVMPADVDSDMSSENLTLILTGDVG
ncbi:LytR C-terminal domain-containing protein [Nocardioides sambongensis]|uniref:LytR C-terminal domain-containing protein n=1 Tax=Nocardioides sambongensis TaxID=2589074 RepID=UPI0011278036|nr:LytR C-terminal domain-containing protein [Nocardioides sambongensis]